MRLRWTVRNPALRRALPLLLRVLAIVVMLVLAGALVLWGIDLARRVHTLGTAPAEPTPKQQLALLQADLTRLAMERDQLAAALDKAGAKDKSLDQQASQIKALELENGKLIDDLAAFASQLPAGKGVAIRQLEAELSAPGVLHYRLLLTQGGKTVPPPLAGQLQLDVTVEQGGQRIVLRYPERGAVAAPQFAVKLGYLQRMDGLLQLPDGAVPRALQVRVLDQGQVRGSETLVVKDGDHVRTPPCQKCN